MYLNFFKFVFNITYFIGLVTLASPQLGIRRRHWIGKLNNKRLLALLFNWAQQHEGESGSVGIAPRVLDLGTRWRWVVSFTPWPLYTQGKSPWYTLDRRFVGHNSQSGRGGKEKKSQPLSGLDPPIIQPVVQRYTTKLHRFQQVEQFKI
jgi:hypothetical protein